MTRRGTLITEIAQVAKAPFSKSVHAFVHVVSGQNACFSRDVGGLTQQGLRNWECSEGESLDLP
jgi:hypothetical protein